MIVDISRVVPLLKEIDEARAAYLAAHAVNDVARAALVEAESRLERAKRAWTNYPSDGRGAP